MRYLRLLLCAPLVAFAACSFHSAHERVADAITRAVIADDLSPVMNRLDPKIEGTLTRVRVAEFSDELASHGPYEGLKPVSGSWCTQGTICFDAQFQDGTYREVMKLDKNGKVRYWWIRPALKQS